MIKIGRQVSWALFMLMCAAVIGQVNGQDKPCCCCGQEMGPPPMANAPLKDIAFYILGKEGAMMGAYGPGLFLEGQRYTAPPVGGPVTKEAFLMCYLHTGDLPDEAVGRAVRTLAISGMDVVRIQAVIRDEGIISLHGLETLRSRVAYLKGKGIPIEINTTVLSHDFPSDLPEGEELHEECCTAGELPAKVNTKGAV